MKRNDAKRDAGASPRSRAPFWQGPLLALVSLAVFFGLTEGLLALFGVESRLRREDPFVGFVEGMPLFVEERQPDGRVMRVTAPNKRGFFNFQEFPREKAPGTVRIFCLGGSTTYGRPYDDRTSFAGWLRELLPAADPTGRWEVVNAGGISYASYRVAKLMEELAAYQPDAFVIYTGHNEFLEERTYGELRDRFGPLEPVVARLARTRTWAAMSGLLTRLRPAPERTEDARTLLPEHVEAKLDHSAGLELYERDDRLREQILAHFELSLERMVAIAGAAGALPVLVVPESNLEDFSPFKSQHTTGLDDDERQRSLELLAAAQEAAGREDWPDALALLDQALDLDPRHAELHYRRGRALLALGRTAEAESAFARARDEDVCPLRALSSIQEIVGRTGRRLGVPLIDYCDLLRRRLAERSLPPIPGAEQFLDHVHPTIESHRDLALALIDELTARGLVTPSPSWGPEIVAQVAARVQAAIDPAEHARALANLALTLSWSGKQEDSRRLAFQALESGSEDPTVLMMVARHHAIQGDADRATDYFDRAVRANPQSPVVRLQYGLFLSGTHQTEAATAQFFLASLLWPDNPKAHEHLAFALLRRGRPRLAYWSLREATRLGPGDHRLAERLAALRRELGPEFDREEPPEIAVTHYPSGFPRTISQVRRDASGREIPDGIRTEWHPGGELGSYAEFERGKPLQPTVDSEAETVGAGDSSSSARAGGVTIATQLVHQPQQHRIRPPEAILHFVLSTASR